MGIYQQPTDKFKCFMCRKLQTNSCPVCNKQTNQSWEIALNIGKKNEKEKQK